MSDLDRTFAALSDPTRRAILARLQKGPATIGELARPFRVSLMAVSKHVRVLERAGLVRREVRGREHHLSLDGGPLAAAHEWTGRYLAWWEARLDALDGYLRAQAAERPPARRAPVRRRGRGVPEDSG